MNFSEAQVALAANIYRLVAVHIADIKGIVFVLFDWCKWLPSHFCSRKTKNRLIGYSTQDSLRKRDTGDQFILECPSSTTLLLAVL